jgi:hypothetical protein
MQRRLGLDKEEVPLHFEGVALRSWVRALGWPVAAVCVVVGIGLAARAAVFAVEGLGVVLAAVGGTLIVALIRCRRFETVVTARLLTVGAGPLRHRVPVGFIERIEVRDATSWRRLYADQEVILQLQSGARTLIFPSHDPAELISVVGGAQDG